VIDDHPTVYFTTALSFIPARPVAQMAFSFTQVRDGPRKSLARAKLGWQIRPQRACCYLSTWFGGSAGVHPCVGHGKTYTIENPYMSMS